MTSKKEKELSSASTSFTFFPPELKLADIKKRIFTRLMKEEHKQLRNDLRAYRLTKGQFAYFFLQEGHDILRWSLVGAASDESLKLLIKAVPTPGLIAVLNKDGCQVLRSFVRAQEDFERFGWYTPEIKEIQISKFKALLSINKEFIENFMTENVSLCTENIQGNFRIALSQFTEEQTAGKVQHTPAAGTTTQERKPVQASTQPAHEASSSSSSSSTSPTQGAGLFDTSPSTRKKKRRRSEKDAGEKTTAQSSSPNPREGMKK